MEGWEQLLTRELQRFLPEPIGDHPGGGRYALYHWDDMLASEFFAGGDLDRLAALAEPQSCVVAASGTSGTGWDRWAFDLGRSIFAVDGAETIEALAGRPAADLLAAAHRSAGRAVVHGVELARVLRRHGIALEDLAEDGVTMPIHVRVVTDGSLLDALRAATGTMDQDGLEPVDPDAEVDPRWQAALNGIADAELRSHLSALFLEEDSARAYGGEYCGAHWPSGSGPIRFAAARVVAGWEFGEGQAWSAVVELATEHWPPTT
ncbi:hypothetical protein MRQ36_28790 [Micromonospora sp. R77]|uniref:hypothetical protein n=1 Tax=Micromonospora sp. R77 TaxID=2925836 RepID=UPI001F61193C|nr:hypothetical protein [Micromonospora sp. R77]MCI4066334.1 hypothetical protein [Micromonospora sp. R77]